MCTMASFIVTRTKVLFSKNMDSHEVIIRENTLRDDGEFVRVEIVPPDNDYSLPLERWQFHVDQDMLPDWWDVREGEIAARNELPNWWRYHSNTETCEGGQTRVFTQGHHVVNGGDARFWGTSTGTVNGGEADFHDNSSGTVNGGDARFWGTSTGTVNGGEAYFYDDSSGTVNGGDARFWDTSTGTVNGGVANFHNTSTGTVNDGVARFWGTSRRLNEQARQGRRKK